MEPTLWARPEAPCCWGTPRVAAGYCEPCGSYLGIYSCRVSPARSDMRLLHSQDPREQDGVGELG